jgi:hypothetical protein
MRCVYCDQESGQYDEHEACVEAGMVSAIPAEESLGDGLAGVPVDDAAVDGLGDREGGELAAEARTVRLAIGLEDDELRDGVEDAVVLRLDEGVPALAALLCGGLHGQNYRWVIVACQGVSAIFRKPLCLPSLPGCAGRRL